MVKVDQLLAIYVDQLEATGAVGMLDTLAQNEGTVHESAFHGVRVGFGSLIVAHTLGFSEREALEIGIGAAVHDVGKGEEDLPQIINSPVKYTDAQKREIDIRHTRLGEAEVTNNLRPTLRCPSARTVAGLITLNHHGALLDSNGQPPDDRLPMDEAYRSGLSIVRFDDKCDATTAPRPYRKEPVPKEVVKAQSLAAIGPERICDVVPEKVFELTYTTSARVIALCARNQERVLRAVAA